LAKLFIKNLNNQFWNHEYDKHGTCTLQNFTTPYDYFSRACALWNKYKVDKWLSNIISNTPTSLAVVESAIKSGFKSQPVLWCNGSAKGVKGNELKEVRLCFDDKLNGKDCPIRKSNCQNNIVIAK
jgi:ribonuclease T2